MIHRRALTAFEYRKYREFWFDLGSHCSRIRRSSSIIARSRSVSVMPASLATSGDADHARFLQGSSVASRPA